MSTGGIGALLAINSAISATGAASTSTSAAASAGSGSASGSSSSGDTTSVVDYPDGSTVTTVRDKAGQVVSITVTPPTTTASASASSGSTVSGSIDLTA